LAAIKIQGRFFDLTDRNINELNNDSQTPMTSLRVASYSSLWPDFKVQGAEMPPFSL